MSDKQIHSRSDVTVASQRNLTGGCGMDQRCHCQRAILTADSPRAVSMSPVESVDSNASLDERLTTVTNPLSIAERRRRRMIPIKLFKNKVERTWHKRYNYVLPPDQQFDLQPFDEIQHRDEEIALEYFYGDYPPSWALGNSKEAHEIRERLLHRYNKEKRKQEADVVAQSASPFTKHMRVESIISVNRTRATETSIFGPSAADKAKMRPILGFVEKLCRMRARDKERQMMNLSDKSRWHFLRLPASREAIREMVISGRKVLARQKFRRTIKVVRAVIRFIRVISMMSRDARHVLTEIHYFQEHQRMETQLKISNQSEGGAPIAPRDIFDPKKYRFASRVKISNQLRMILSKPWNLRTDEEVDMVVDRLQALRSFVEYPVSFQRKLARLAWLIEVAADLAIIREGHCAADFYFMLAGRAKMIVLHGSPYLAERGGFHTLRILRKGDAFGDESMSDPDSERAYSVITTEESTLLSLSSVDYVTMLLNTRDDEQAPEHIIFLSSLAFLADFPKQKLIQEGDEFIKNYYLRSGSVICGCLSESEYIYIVKMGSCRVLVELPPANCMKKKGRRSAQEDRKSVMSSVEEESIFTSDKKGAFVNRLNRRSSVMEFLNYHRDEIANNPLARKALKDMKRSSIDSEFQVAKAESDVIMRKSRRLFRSLKQSSISNSLIQTSNHAHATMNFAMKKTSLESTEASQSSQSSLSTSNSVETTNTEIVSSEQSIGVGTSRPSKHSVEKHLSFIVNEKSHVERLQRAFSGLKHAVGTNIDIGIDLNAEPVLAEASEADLSERTSMAFEESDEQVQEFGKPKLPPIPTKFEVQRKHSALKFSKWKLTRVLVKGDYIGQEWVNLNRGPFDPPEEEMSLVSDGCEVIMMKRAFLIKYLRKEL